jgi:Ankyrin repeats (3 copies)/Ankyrin repeats (many copies)
MKNFWHGALLVVVLLCGSAWPQVEASRDHARQVVLALPPDNFLRRLVEDGRLGDGVERPWHPVMRQLGVKAASVEVHMIWFFGPRKLTAVRVVYYNSYDGHDRITDTAKLTLIRGTGLEEKVKAEAIRRAPEGHWVDLPYSQFRPFRAAAAVTIWDDPWLPSAPHLFTTFGPGRPPLVAAVGFGDLADIDRLLASGKIDREAINEAFWYACSERDATVLQRLVKAGADVNQTAPGQEFGTCLMTAIWSGAPEAVKILLASGAKVNGPQGKYDETPLTLAASLGAGSGTVVKLLLDAGANVKAANSYGLTPVMKAANRKAEPASVLELLLTRGADVNARDQTNRTALWFASEKGNVDAVKLLLAAHADANPRDRQGRSAMDMAASKQVADLLIAAGAKK